MPQSFLSRLFWWVPAGSAPEIPSQELHEILADKTNDIQILDVRTEQEFKDGHIEGAINSPITSLKSNLDSLSLDKEKPVIAICLSAHRSIPAVRLLQRNGYKNVRQLQGGMRAWKGASFPTVKA